MKKIIFGNTFDTIDFPDINEHDGIFAKINGILVGMIIKNSKGWILKIGSQRGATGYHPTLKKCLKNCLKHGYEFYVAEQSILINSGKLKTEAEMAGEALLALGKIGCSLPPKDTIGWRCPVCGKGNAPFAYRCENCESSNV